MSLKLYKRPNGIWHIRGTVQGERFDHSSKTRSRSEADQIRAKWEADAFKRSVYGQRAVATFAEAVIGYIKAGGDPTHLDPLVEAFGDLKLSAITQERVDDLAAGRSTKPSTLVRQVYTPLLAVMNQAAEQGLCDAPRIRKPAVKSGRTDYLTPAQAQAWIDALPPHLSRLIVFLLATGCRITEALSLEWKDVTTDKHRVVFWDTKGDYARGVDLGQRARTALGDRGEGIVFRTAEGEPWHAYDAINTALRRTRKPLERKVVKTRRGGRGDRLDLRPASCHLFRHTWATWAYACTRDLTFLMSQGGWRSLSMVQRYTHVGSPDLGRGVLAEGWEFSGRELPGLTPKGRKRK